MHLLDLKKAGATDAILESAEVWSLVGSFVLVLVLVGHSNSKVLRFRKYILSLQSSLQLGSKLLKDFGVMSDDVSFISQLFRDSMELQAQDTFDKTGDRDSILHLFFFWLGIVIGMRRLLYLWGIWSHGQGLFERWWWWRPGLVAVELGRALIVVANL